MVKGLEELNAALLSRDAGLIFAGEVFDETVGIDRAAVELMRGGLAHLLSEGNELLVGLEELA